LDACSIFSFAVTHSKLLTLLLILSPSIWFTSGLFSGLGINVLEIRRLRKIKSTKEIANIYNISSGAIWAVLSGKSWAHI